jgi:hypothetical protein
MNLDELEALAAAATPSPWTEDDCNVLFGGNPCYYKVASTEQGEGNADEDAAYIAACSPSRIIALVRVARAADRVVQQTTADGAYALHDELIDALRALEDTP